MSAKSADGFDTTEKSRAGVIEALRHFFRPKGVALVGSVDASPRALAQIQRFGCPAYFVNPKGGDGGPISVYRSIAEVPEPLDLVILKIGPARCVTAIEDAGRRGVKNALIWSSGFAEVGPEGAALEAKLGEVARQWGVHILGPNTNENAFEPMPRPVDHSGGLIALITHSGHNGRPVVQGVQMGAGFSRWVPTGNEVDLEAADFISYFSQDEESSVIAGYIEGFKSIPNLRRALISANENDVPVVVLKIGRTGQGASMATSHTGHLSGSDQVIQGLFDQHAVTRVSDLDELLETANLFAKVPAATGPRVALYSISGGSGTLMAEVAATYAVPAPTLNPETELELHKYIPDYLTVSNPIDNGGTFMMTAPEDARLAALEAIAADPNIDIIVIGLTGAIPAITDPFGADIKRWARRIKKPIVATWNSVKIDEAGYSDLVQSGVPIFRSFRNCFAALRDFNQYQVARNSFRVRASLRTPLNRDAMRTLERQGTLPASEAKLLLESVGVDLAREALARDAAQAAVLARQFGYPVVLKLISDSFPHKTELGLVKLNIMNEQELLAASQEFLAIADKENPEAVIEGILVQEQIGNGVEMLLGLTNDPQAGPALTIGAGGVFAELHKDVAVRPLPVDEQDVREMIGGLRSSAVLAGWRGAPAADLDAFVKMALAVARLGESAAGKLGELDLNPVIVLPHRAVAVDSLVLAR